MSSFEKLGVSLDLRKSINDMGFESPMPIQEQVIPLILTQNKDLIGLAQTGTGKTAAFGLPILQRISLAEKKPQALILSPTRELCMQIAKEMEKFAKYIDGLNIVVVYGGADIQPQIKKIQKSAQIVVATPGRMVDLLKRRKVVDFSAIKTVVLDEADEMLNMGFKEDLDAILEDIPSTRNTLLFSATMPKEVLEISKNYMNNPEKIIIGKQNSGADNVEHICYSVRAKERYLALKRIVDFNPDIYGIIFCRTRYETKEVAEKLIQDGYNADALHGDLSQVQRELTMHKFRIGNLQMLVATDVAARGLDVKNISHIINYNLPDDNCVYTHRSGRTGRAGEQGTSIVIINLKEKYRIKQIESKLGKKFQHILVPGWEAIGEKQLFNLVERMKNTQVDHKTIEKFLPRVYEELNQFSREELIQQFVSVEFNRFIDYYKNIKDLNPPQSKYDGKKEKRRTDEKYGNQFADQDKAFNRFYINLGRRDNVTPSELIGLIKQCTRKRNINIGRIDIIRSHAVFEVEKKHTSLVLSGFKDIEHQGRKIIVKIDDGDHNKMPKKKKTGAESKMSDFRKKKYPKTKGTRRYIIHQ